MDEIATQSSQLLVHEAVKRIAKEHREKQERAEQFRKTNEEMIISQRTNEDIVNQEEADLDRDDAIRRSLVQEVIDSAAQSGNPLPASAVKLLNNFRGIYYYLHY